MTLLYLVKRYDHVNIMFGKEIRHYYLVKRYAIVTSGEEIGYLLYLVRRYNIVISNK